MELERFRGRMPLVAFILLLVICAALIGFACACLGDQLAAGLERLFMPAIVAVWLAIAAVPAAHRIVSAHTLRATGRASPAQLQRFLF